MQEIVSATEQPSKNIAAVAAREDNPAGYMYERMLQMIEAHQDRLPEDYELGVQVIGGAAPPFHLRQISYSNPDILIFLGKDVDGNIIQLMQHYSQMSVLLLGMRKLEEKAYRIGFTAK